MKYFILFIICLILLYLYLIFPRFSRKKEIEPYFKFMYAHRGLHNQDFPENTLAAFERAKNFGYGIELDVQLTKDQIPVICHDFNLKRVSGIDRQIDTCTYEELKQVKLFNTTYTIPTFKEVLDLIDHKVPLIIEIKQKGINCQTCVKICELLDQYQNNFVIESFNPMAMNWFLKNRPNFIRGQLSSDFSSDSTMHPLLRFSLKHLLANVLSRPDFIAYDIVHRKEFSFQILKHFITTVGWTCKNEKMMEEIKKDYDFIIFENFLPKTG